MLVRDTVIIKASTLAHMPIPWKYGLTGASQSNGYCRLPHTKSADTGVNVPLSIHERRTSQIVYWVIIEAACMSGAVLTHLPHAQ